MGFANGVGLALRVDTVQPPTVVRVSCSRAVPRDDASVPEITSMNSHGDRRLVVVLSLLLFLSSGGVLAQSSTDDTATAATRLELVARPSHRGLVHTVPVCRRPDTPIAVVDDERRGRRSRPHRPVGGRCAARIGMLDVEVEEPEPREAASVSTFGLSLSRTTSGWSLEVAAGETEPPAPAAILGTVDLAHGMSDVAAPTLIGSLLADGNDDARLTLHWGRHTWSANLRFPMPREAPPRRRRLSGVAEARSFSFDSTALQRRSRLSARNTNTVVLPDGTRFSTIYPKKLEVTSRDFAHLVSVRTDSVVRVIDGAVIRLETDVPLHFGDQVLDTGNVGLADSPGAYGVWLKRAADGWKLVFNDEPDAWGTQHDAVFDAAEVDPRYAQSDLIDDSMRDASRALSTSVVMTGPDQGQFVLVWGPHEWSADFTIAR